MKIVKDKKYPEMYRIRWPDGTLSVDMYNSIRAKDYIKRESIINLEKGSTVHLQ